MSDEHRWRRKCFCICLLALFIGLIGIVLPEQEDIAFEVIINNTELCQYNHTLNRCTGERNTSTLYWTNDSAIQIFLISHANTAGANASIQLYINGTQVEHTSGRPLAAAEDNYKSISAIIPKGSNYSATFLNHHHYEWREYPILSGRNGTLSINQTIISNDIAFEIIINNTNLAPTQHGFVGTGERLNNTDYYANNSAIQIFLYAHTADAGQWANIDLFINDTAVMHEDSKFADVGEVINVSMSAIIPKGAKYRANFTSIHHFEWREYPILSGRNGTLSINQTIVQGGGASNLSQLTIDTNKSWFGYNIYNVTIDNQSMGNKVNKTGDTMSGQLNMSYNNISSANNITGAHIMASNFNFTLFNADTASGAYGFQLHGLNKSEVGTFFTYSSNTAHFPVFFAGKSHGWANETYVNWSAVRNQETLFRFSAVGDTGTAFSGSRAIIDFLADGDWNATSQPTRIDVWTTALGSTAVTKRMTIYGNGSIQINNLAGAGNAYTCVDPTGKLYRGSPGC